MAQLIWTVGWILLFCFLPVYFFVKMLLTHLLYKFFFSDFRCKYTPHRTFRLILYKRKHQSNKINKKCNSKQDNTGIEPLRVRNPVRFLWKKFPDAYSCRQEKKLPRLSSPPLSITYSSRVGVPSHTSWCRLRSPEYSYKIPGSFDWFPRSGRGIPTVWSSFQPKLLIRQQTDKPICCHNNATSIILLHRIQNTCNQ